jgi:hypothetical protein
MDWLLANSRAVEYGTPGKIHLNALFWICALNLLLDILEEHNGKQLYCTISAMISTPNRLIGIKK